MFCEVGHLVMTSLQVTGPMVADACAPDEIPDVVTQRQSTFDPDWRRPEVSNWPGAGSYLHAMLSV